MHESPQDEEELQGEPDVDSRAPSRRTANQTAAAGVVLRGGGEVAEREA